MSLYYKIKSAIFPEGSPRLTPQFRLECRSRDANNKDALAMCIADPLWMLGRQWQFGEFQAEDNGSPIGVTANYRSEKVNFYSLGHSDLRQPIGNRPTEAIVEAMEVKPNDLRSKVRIGQKFEDLIREAFSENKAKQFIQDLRTELPLTAGKKEEELSENSQLFFKLMAGKVLDGGTLWEKIQQKNFPTENYSELNEVTKRLKNWYAALFFSPSHGTAWQSQQLHHAFSLHHKLKEETNNFTLSAPDYQSGHLDWYSFDKSEEVSISPTENTKDTEALIPIRVSFAGMPDNRLFSFEDSQLDLANMELGTDDLVKMMLVNFSLYSGSDWYAIPLKIGLGELCWVNHLKVKDVFGVTTPIFNDENTGNFLSEDGLAVWDVFKIRDKNVKEFHSPDHFLYLAPATFFRLESKPLEELLFLRDEFANMVWGIEKTVCNEMGKSTNGFDLHLELNGPFLKGSKNEAGEENRIPKFRLATTVPTNWIPYLPVHLNGSNQEIELRRALMMRNQDAESPEDIEPLSTLARDEIVKLREEAIPRAGIRVQITHQRVRWTDGKTYIWKGRKVLAGKGEGSSGLIFDQLQI